MSINKRKIIRHHYTIVELLVVLAVVGILTGITVSGIQGALGRQGAAAAVRTLGNKISLTRSFAVSRNRYVALLLPDSTSLNSRLDGASASHNPIASGNTGGFDDSYLFTKTRLCYVTKDTSVSPNVYNFDRWVEGYEWQELPSKTVAFIVSESTTPEDSNSASVLKIDADSSKKSSAVIFKPAGALVDARDVIIRVYRAAFLPEVTSSNFIWQGKETPSQGWKIGINGFTGRTKFCLGGDAVDEE
ncbi:MAG: hypothetical protein PHV59_08370 [Victivallales bacterium]|nr:hypothetical protein [Victivallales bacterium]